MKKYRNNDGAGRITYSDPNQDQSSNRKRKRDRGSSHFGVNHGLNLYNGNRNMAGETSNAFGYKRLAEFLTQSNDEVVMALYKSTHNFQQNLQQNCNDEMMTLLIEVIGEKICGETSLHEIQNNLVTLCTQSFFLENILRFTSQIPLLESSGVTVDQISRLLNALTAFYSRICARMPAFASDKLLPYIQNALFITELLSSRGSLEKEKSTEIGSRLSILIQDINTKKAATPANFDEERPNKFRKRLEITAEEREKLYQIIPDVDFRKMNIIPCKYEIMFEEEPFLRPNLIHGKYPSSLTYLDVQFRLLREDFIAPLREAIKEYSTNARPPPGTVRIYRDVKLHQLYCTQGDTFFTMKFSTNNLKIKWENSKRLLSGSLLILTPDSLNSIFFATVGRRDIKNLSHGLIDIIWEGNRPTTYKNASFLMIECEVYFESYRHTLKALQDLAEPCPPNYDRLRLETFKMCKYIVNVTSDQIQPPEYIRTEKIDFKMILKCNQEAIEACKQKPKIKPKLKCHKINALELADWPSAEELGMDNPQYVAFQSAITQELAIIQGPPGTGKTYIGLQIMKLLLGNSLTNFDCPILIVCYTNHALDQFLEGILSIMHSLQINPYGKLIRVGGQSKVEDIQEYSIRNIRKDYLRQKKFDHNYAQLRSRTKSDVSMYQNYRADLVSLFSDLSKPEGIVDFYSLGEQFRPGIFNNKFDLTSILPIEIATVFSNEESLLHFLQMDDLRFDSYSTEDILKRWFVITPVNKRQKREVNIEVDAPEGAESEEFEDEELRSILVAHRMEEEIMEEEKAYNAQRLKYYLHNKDNEKFQSKENLLWEQLQVARNMDNYEDAQRFKEHLYLLGLRRNKFIKQLNFITDILRCYQDGRVVLPKVTLHMLQHKTLQSLSIAEKWAIYFHCIEEIKKYLLNEIIKTEEAIIKDQKTLKDVVNQGDGLILQQARVVGMTTTGAAKYNTVLRMMKSKIVIFEEAAEVLESHIVTSITEHCEHLILIGDHQQLRPPTTVYKLAKDYQLDISLFERLIKNDISWHYLRAQHRMRPEICKLLVPTIYKDLEDHASVHSYPPVRGFEKNIFFITHSNMEKTNNDSMTKSNEYEARYIVQLCRYMVLQGYEANQVTVLTTYIGQMFLIKKFIMQEGNTCKGVRVTVVDNFQGEENDIILLSLVRSNKENKIGFLRTDNRICVALSRAKQGLYILGNMDCLVNSSNTWKEISNELQAQESIGPGLKLRCQNHKELMEINSPEEFRQKSPEGGCTRMCSEVLPRCDHACRSVCHIIDREHKLYECREKCKRRCPDTARHTCPELCSHYPCPPCQIKMQRLLPCRHSIKLPCHIDINTYKCKEFVRHSLKCNHIVTLPCNTPVQNYVCETKVNKTLDCGHTKLLPCNIPTTKYECVEMVAKELDCGHGLGKMKCIEDPSKFNCRMPCSRKLLCGHEQEAPCNDDIVNIKCLTMVDEIKIDCKHKVKIRCYKLGNYKNWNCLADCDTRLDCGHQCLRKCHLNDDPKHLKYKCMKNCASSCINDHRCKQKHPCYEKCPPCNRLHNTTLDCGHEIKVVCSQNLDEWQCQEPCQRTASCGHKCEKICGIPCDPCITMVEKKSIDCSHTLLIACSIVPSKSECNQLVPSKEMSLCGHIVEVPCKIQNSCSPEDLLRYCRRPCGYKFDYEGGCGHTCQGTCSSCFQGRIHVKCSSKCERMLACGHVCTFPCSSLCPPCDDVCILQCKHSKCKRKCGEPCINCKENCRWACKHARCFKKCSDICNRSPCDEPCKKKLKCGHDCIGCCGDPCPPFCRFCDKDTVQEILFGQEDEEDARFVYLENCGHIIHRESMDTWMFSSTDKSGSRLIDVKRCPKCKTIITNCDRYGNIIKKHLDDVIQIRKKIFGNNRAQKKTQQNIVNKIQRSDYVCFKDVRDFLGNTTFVLKQSKTNNREVPKIDLHLVDIDQYTFESIHNIMYWWEEAENIVQLNVGSNKQKQVLTSDYRKNLIQMCHKFFKLLLERKLPLSTHEIDDFEQEFTRVYDFYRLGLRQGINNFLLFNGAQEMYNSAHKHIMEIKPYDKDMQKTFETYLLKLEAVIKTGWESEKRKRDDERSNRTRIFSAMGFGGNHWYRCTNGHLYVVADCGALNQTGTCNECQSIIGRGSQNIHAVRSPEAIQRQIDSAIPMEDEYPPSFQDRNRSRHYHRDGNYRRHNYQARGNDAGRRRR